MTEAAGCHSLWNDLGSASLNVREVVLPFGAKEPMPS